MGELKSAMSELVKGDQCGDLAEFEVTPSVKYSFSDFSYKVLLHAQIVQHVKLLCDLLLQPHFVYALGCGRIYRN